MVARRRPNCAGSLSLSLVQTSMGLGGDVVPLLRKFASDTTTLNDFLASHPEAAVLVDASAAMHAVLAAARFDVSVLAGLYQGDQAAIDTVAAIIAARFHYASSRAEGQFLFVFEHRLCGNASGSSTHAKAACVQERLAKVAKCRQLVDAWQQEDGRNLVDAIARCRGKLYADVPEELRLAPKTSVLSAVRKAVNVVTPALVRAIVSTLQSRRTVRFCFTSPDGSVEFDAFGAMVSASHPNVYVLCNDSDLVACPRDKVLLTGRDAGFLNFSGFFNGHTLNYIDLTSKLTAPPPDVGRPDLPILWQLLLKAEEVRPGGGGALALQMVTSLTGSNDYSKGIADFGRASIDAVYAADPDAFVHALVDGDVKAALALCAAHALRPLARTSATQAATSDEVTRGVGAFRDTRVGTTQTLAAAAATPPKDVFPVFPPPPRPPMDSAPPRPVDTPDDRALLAAELQPRADADLKTLEGARAFIASPAFVRDDRTGRLRQATIEVIEFYFRQQQLRQLVAPPPRTHA